MQRSLTAIAGLYLGLVRGLVSHQRTLIDAEQKRATGKGRAKRMHADNARMQRFIAQAKVLKELPKPFVRLTGSPRGISSV